MGPGLVTRGGTGPPLCTGREVCRFGGGMMRNFLLVPSVFLVKGDEVINYQGGGVRDMREGSKSFPRVGMPVH